MITATQIVKARQLLGWSQARLAESCGQWSRLISEAEDPEQRPVSDDTMKAIQRALEEAGVEFTPRNGVLAGVRLRKVQGTPE